MAKAAKAAQSEKPKARSKKASFPVNSESPFPDGYDIVGEREALADLCQADNPDSGDPRWERFVELCDREEALKRSMSAAHLRQHAEPIVSDREAQGMMRIGELIGEEADSMTLHTREAYRLFIGRSREEGGRGYGEVSGKKIAAALRFIWLMSSHDNPYADMVLVQMCERVDDLRQQINRMIEGKVKSLEQLRNRGLNFSILKSRAPVHVELGFRSPYGYTIAELIVDFDYCARVFKTLIVKDQLTDREGRELLHLLMRQIRSIFEQMMPFQRNLQREELAPLSRADWASEDDLAKKRVKASVALFGECPRDIFTGERAPRHSRRKAEASAQELEFLKRVSLSGSDEQEAGATEMSLI